MTFTLPYPPSANNYWRAINVRGQRRVVVSAEARAYKTKVAMLLLSKRLQPFVNAVRVTVRIYRPARRGDLDNTLKVLLDSLRGFAFRDDSQVIEIHARRLNDAKNPRAEVEVHDAEPKPEVPR